MANLLHIEGFRSSLMSNRKILWKNITDRKPQLGKANTSHLIYKSILPKEIITTP